MHERGGAGDLEAVVVVVIMVGVVNRRPLAAAAAALVAVVPAAAAALVVVRSVGAVYPSPSSLRWRGVSSLSFTTSAWFFLAVVRSVGVVYPSLSFATSVWCHRRCRWGYSIGWGRRMVSGVE
jgi:hypothetical protein